MIGFHNLPEIPLMTLSDSARFSAFLEYTIVVWEANRADSAVALWQAALRSVIVVWNPVVYDSIMRIMKQKVALLPDWKPLAWYYEAWHYFAIGETSYAIKTYKRCIQTWEQLGLVEEAAEVKVALARIFHSSGDFKQAMELYHQSVEVLLLSEAQRNRAAALALNNMADISLACLELQDAEEYCSQALSLLSPGDYSSVGYTLSATLRNLGNVYRIRGNWDKAMEYYGQSLFSAREQGNQSDEAKTLNCMANVYLHIEEHQKAEGLFCNSLDIHSKGQDHVWVALNLSGLGELAGIQGRNDEALQLLVQAEEIMKSMVEHRLLLTVLRRKIQIYLNLGDYNLARGAIQMARALLDGSINLRMQAYLDEQEGCLNLGIGNLVLAKHLLSKSIYAFHQAQIQYKESDILYAMGTLHEREGNLSEALELFQQSAALAKEVNYSSKVERAMSATRRLYGMLN